MAGEGIEGRDEWLLISSTLSPQEPIHFGPVIDLNYQERTAIGVSSNSEACRVSDVEGSAERLAQLNEEYRRADELLRACRD